MTYLKKAREERPDLSIDFIVKGLCPEALNFKKPCVKETLSCWECWNQEMPEKEE